MRGLARLLLLTTFGAWIATAAAGQTALLPLGQDFPLLDVPGCAQREVDVAALPGGRFVAVWAEGANLIVGGIFEGDGSPVGPRFNVDSVDAALHILNFPKVAANAAGTFMVVWEDTGALQYRMFAPTGQPLGPESVLLAQRPPAGSALAALADGGFAVVTAASALELRRFTAAGQPAGVQVLDSLGLPIGGDYLLIDPAIAAHGESGVVVVWTANRSGRVAVEGRILEDDGSEVSGVPFEADTVPLQGFQLARPRVASCPAGTIFVSWGHFNRFTDASLLARVFAPDGSPLGQTFPVIPSTAYYFSDSEVVSDSAGDFLIAWTDETVRLRRYSPRGLLLGPTSVVPAAEYLYGFFAPPALAIDVADRLTVAWAPNGYFFPSGPQCYSDGLFARRFDASPPPLTLQGGRFRLEVRWTDHAGHAGDGKPVAITADSGYFWFFGPDNVELMVKVLDGRAVNGRFWVFYGSLSDVAYTITVTDTVSGLSKDYENPAGELASHGDTATFVAAPPPAAAQGVSATAARPAVVPLADETAALGPCADPASPRRPGLCLGGRFEVEAIWVRGSHDSGVGAGVPLTADSGYLWFFGANNAEMVVKVLDGRAVNGRFWVFLASLSNVQYRLTVRDTTTGAERIYANPSGQFHSRADIDAF